MDCKALVARRRLAFGSREGVFLFGLRVQEDGEVLAYWQVALLHQFFRRRACHHPVVVVDGVA